MKTVKYIIEELISQEFEIEVEDSATVEEIKKQIKKEYLDGETVVEDGDLESAKAYITSEDGDLDFSNAVEIV